MKVVTWTDDIGRKYWKELPNDVDESEAEFGNTLGPPSLDGLDLPEKVVVEVHNWLFDMNIRTAAQAHQHRNDISAILRRVVAPAVEAIVDAYGAVEKVMVVATISMPAPANASSSPAINNAKPRRR